MQRLSRGFFNQLARVATRSSGSQAGAKSGRPKSITTYRVPQLADGVDEGVLQKWLKHEGDYVHDDDVIATIDTEAFTLEYRAQEPGRIVKLHAQEGQTVYTNNPLVDVDLAGKESDVAADTSAPAAKAQS